MERITIVHNASVNDYRTTNDMRKEHAKFLESIEKMEKQGYKPLWDTFRIPYGYYRDTAFVIIMEKVDKKPGKG